MSDTIIVSGGTRGLGLKLVKLCLAKDLSVFTFARRATEEIEELSRANPDRVHFRELDITDSTRVSELVDEAHKHSNGLYGLINNAAVGQDNLIAQLPPEQIESIVAINVTAMAQLTRQVVRKLLLGQGGNILNISSICGSRGFPALSVYSATKGATNAFTLSLARELGDRNILVNAIAPGFFESEMSSVLSQEQLATIKRRTPLQRLISPEDILPLAELLMFNNTAITGQVISIDGGASV